MAATPVTTVADERAPCPCLHGGTCLLIPATGQHVCKCAPLFGPTIAPPPCASIALSRLQSTDSLLLV